MAQLIFDLSGRAGLSPFFWGDVDTVVPSPHRILTSGKDQMAAGRFNPYLRDGYLAPITTTTETVSVPVGIVDNLHSVEYDIANNKVFYADNSYNVWSLDSTTDTSLTSENEITSAPSLGFHCESIHDLQMYELNGVQKLFYSGVGSPANYTKTAQPFALSGPAAGQSHAAMMIKPSGNAMPVVAGSDFILDSASGTTLTKSVTVPAGSNRAMLIYVWYEGSSTTVTATLGAQSFSSVATYTSSIGPNLEVLELPAPTAGAGTLTVTYASARTNRICEIVFLTGVDQTTVSVANHTSGVNFTTILTSTQTTERLAYRYGITIYGCFWGTHDVDVFNRFTEISNRNHTLIGSYTLVGKTGIWVDYNGYSILSGIVGATTIEEASWSTAGAVGAFIHKPLGGRSFVRAADNGFAYLFADNSVHKMDGGFSGGSAGAVTKNVLLFPEYMSITDAIDYRSNMFIALHTYRVDQNVVGMNTFTGKCGIYTWDKSSVKFSSGDYVEIAGAREIKKLYISPDGVMKAITISNDGLTELRQFGYNDSGGVVYNVVGTLNVGSSPKYHDGLTIANNMAVWLGNDGTLYSERGNRITKLFVLKETGTTTDSLVNNIQSGTVFYGYGTATGGDTFRTNKQAITMTYYNGVEDIRIRRIYPFSFNGPSGSAQATAQGDVYTEVNYIPVTSFVKSLRVYNAPIAGSGTDVVATVKLYFNQSTTPSLPTGMTKSITKDEAKRGYVDFKINSHNIHAIQLEVEWNTSISYGTDLYLPSFAVLDHEITETRTPDNT